jgi:hypothetical protein
MVTQVTVNFWAHIKTMQKIHQKQGQQAHDTNLEALFGKKSQLCIHSSTISTAMLSKIDDMAIHARESLGGAYTTYMCHRCCR